MSLLVITGGLLLHFYSHNCGIDSGIFPVVISFAGTLSTLIFLPCFTYALLCIPVSRLTKTILILTAVFYSSAAIVILPKAREYNLIGPFAGDIKSSFIIGVSVFYGLLFYGTLGYCFTLGMLKRKTIGDSALRKIRISTFECALFFLLLLILFTSLGKQDAAVIVLALMFLSISSINTFYSFSYSNQPVFLQGNSLTESFTSRFQISEREKDILLLLLDGMANKEIAEKLFISVRTVENHLSRIYQKTGTNSRMQVVNLIRANSL
jgi:DNA-binding CsgD family transcriptional regulator